MTIDLSPEAVEAAPECVWIDLNSADPWFGDYGVHTTVAYASRDPSNDDLPLLAYIRLDIHEAEVFRLRAERDAAEARGWERGLREAEAALWDVSTDPPPLGLSDHDAIASDGAEWAIAQVQLAIRALRNP